MFRLSRRLAHIVVVILGCCCDDFIAHRRLPDIHQSNDPCKRRYVRVRFNEETKIRMGIKRPRSRFSCHRAQGEKEQTFHSLHRFCSLVSQKDNFLSLLCNDLKEIIKGRLRILLKSQKNSDLTSTLLLSNCFRIGIINTPPVSRCKVFPIRKKLLKIF